MAGQVLKKRRLVNPGRRHMTPKQIRYFGTPRQKAALRNKRRRAASHGSGSKRTLAARARKAYWKRVSAPRKKNWGRRGNQDRAAHSGMIHQVEHAAERAIERIEDVAEDALHSVGIGNRGRRKNVGEILTVIPANPGRRKNRMTRTKNRRRNRARNRVHNRRRNRMHNRRHRNRTRNPKVVVRYRNRRRNARYNRGRRRNPNFLAGDAGAVIGVLGGATITKLLAGMIPSNFATGWTGIIATGVVAAVQGTVAGKLMKNPRFGQWMTIGGLLLVGLEVLNQLVPGLQLPFTASGTSGMGLITSSNFYVPQANVPGSMATFVTPAGVTAALPVVTASSAASGMHGLGTPQFSPGLRTMRRVGRLR